MEGDGGTALALGDATRVRLLGALRSGRPMSVGVLTKRLKLPQPTVSHHLGLLGMPGLIRARRNGKRVFYSVNTEAFRRAMAFLNSVTARPRPRAPRSSR